MSWLAKGQAGHGVTKDGLGTHGVGQLPWAWTALRGQLRVSLSRSIWLETLIASSERGGGVTHPAQQFGVALRSIQRGGKRQVVNEA